MHLSATEFERWESKAITLLGMSGVGKTTLANKLPKNRWFHYSGDYRIGTKYLGEPILDNIKSQVMQIDFLSDLLRSDSIYIGNNITVNNLELISAFLGKPGNPERGGLSLAEFSRRQALHHAAEVKAMCDVSDFIEKVKTIYGYEHFINDAGGSVCELEDSNAIELLAEKTLILYIEANDILEALLKERRHTHPKPLYYCKDFFQAQLVYYLQEKNLSDCSEMDPDDFTLWIFPKLITHRRPRYRAIAKKFGYTVSALDVEQIQNETDFLSLVRDTLTTDKK